MLLFFHVIIPPGQFAAVRVQDAVEKEDLIYPLYLFIGVAFSRLDCLEHGGVEGGPVFKVVRRLVNLHFQVCGFAVVEGDMDIQTRRLGVKVHRCKVIDAKADAGNFASGTGRKKVAEGFAGVLGIRSEHSLKDYVIHYAEGLVLFRIFFCQPFEFP